MNNNNICTPEVASENPSHSGAPPRRRGAPRGNQNARRHGAYSRYFEQELREKLSKAADLPALDRELYLALIHAGKVVHNPPDNERVVNRLTARLVMLICLKYDLSPDDREGIVIAVDKAADNLSRLEKAVGPLMAGSAGMLRGIV